MKIVRSLCTSQFDTEAKVHSKRPSITDTTYSLTEDGKFYKVRVKCKAEPDLDQIALALLRTLDEVVATPAMMDDVPWKSMQFTTNNAYGPIAAYTEFDIADHGYTAVVGRNNAGKSALLQSAFLTLHGSEDYAGGRVVIVFPERTDIADTAQPGGDTLENYNHHLTQQISQQPLVHAGGNTINHERLTRLLLNHTNLVEQMTQINAHLNYLGFPDLTMKLAQQFYLEDHRAVEQGTGLRCVLPIVAALTDPAIRAILIDEPENSLEPLVQKRLRDLLIAEAGEKMIVVATHSHLFLNRRAPDRNLVIESVNGVSEVTSIQTEEELADLTFNLLGNDTEDLFFPYNYLIVEGSSESALCERIIKLLDELPHRIKVVAAGGITRVKNRATAVEESLTPLVMRDSPYKGRVVALVDRPRDKEQAVVQRIAEVLGERLFVLKEETLEDQLPADLYERASLNKDETLEELGKLHLQGNKPAENDLKATVSNGIGGILDAGDLSRPELRPFVEAIQMAASETPGAS